jgi:hypothetical protein
LLSAIEEMDSKKHNTDSTMIHSMASARMKVSESVKKWKQHNRSQTRLLKQENKELHQIVE